MRSVYLKRMGINEWVLRDDVTPSHAQDLFFQVLLKNANGKTLGFIVAEIDPLVDVDIQSDLLCKIAGAMTPTYDCLQSDLVDFSPSSDCFVIGLGAVGHLDLKEITSVIRSNSLSNLLANPDQKKALWGQIKSLRDLFHE